MTKDFAMNFCGGWRDGCHPSWKPDQIGNVTVNYDQYNHSYDIDDDWDDFIEWVAVTWQSDNEPLSDGEDAQSYLDRRGIRIRRTHD